MVRTNELKLDLIIHADYEVLELSETELVPVKFERQLPFQINGELRERHTLFVFCEHLNYRLFHGLKFRSDLSFLLQLVDEDFLIVG